VAALAHYDLDSPEIAYYGFETNLLYRVTAASGEGFMLRLASPGWQGTIAGEREIKKALRKTLWKYQLHQEQDLFDRAYAYIREYY